MRDRKIFLVILIIIPIAIFGMSLARAESTGRAIEFLIEENGAKQPQIALVQDGKIFIKRISTNPNQDFLFDASNQTLYIINHQDKSYYRIDQNVINKVASMVDSITTIAESQQGVLSDLLSTMGFSKEEAEVKIEIKETDKILSSANINCRLYQEYRNNGLVSELCIAPKENLSILGEHYDVVNSFYLFGDQLLNKAGSILSNMGMILPKLTKFQKNGMPILMYMAKEKIKTSLISIKNKLSSPDNFQLPNGYVQTPIPFIG